MVLQLGQLGQVKLKLSKIWVAAWANMLLSSTAQTRWTLEDLGAFSKVLFFFALLFNELLNHCYAEWEIFVLNVSFIVEMYCVISRYREMFENFILRSLISSVFERIKNIFSIIVYYLWSIV